MEYLDPISDDCMISLGRCSVGLLWYVTTRPHTIATLFDQVLRYQLWRFINTTTGKVHLERLHRQYGPIVRVSPNELSFGSVESWKAIYGASSTERRIPPKGEFWDIFGAGFAKSCIASERDPARHGEMKKMLSAAFSQRSLLEQEGIVSETIDLFVRIIGEEAAAAELGPAAGLDMVKWFDMVSFDVLGEMAFGESFHSLESGSRHFWSALVEDHMYLVTLIDNIAHLGAVAKMMGYLIPSRLLVKNKVSQYSRDKVDKILSSNSRRKDFISLLVSKVHNGEMDKEELAAHVSTLVIAGGETVATSLSGTIFFLLRHPERMRRLTNEIRDRFAQYEDITAAEAQRLPYLQAVINESLRLYPPASQGFPRTSPGFQVHGQHIPAGTEIYTSTWTVSHDEQYFLEPMSFLPERWLDTKTTDRREASQPFSLGPRGCLGRNFAWMEINLILSKMLWTYNLELVDQDIDFVGLGHVFIMWSKPKLHVKLRKSAETLI
ncbi:Cytochrome P450 [Cordyceps militaris CM01]|uniref:Cytochrome P450 n=1 Tax=Cordyceps militaris (strain CM01) TaxID=983644 RepID=G3JI25_CORMM|nr:Cytochrome P450 [Cordyceps militaris CM01]EGX91828.1 Cytochrome P450 [Cordyceps militaris CM01]